MLYYHRYEGDKQQYGSAAGRVENDGVYAGATAVFGLLRRLLHPGSGRGFCGQLGAYGPCGHYSIALYGFVSLAVYIVAHLAVGIAAVYEVYGTLCVLSRPCLDLLVVNGYGGLGKAIGQRHGAVRLQHNVGAGGGAYRLIPVKGALGGVVYVVASIFTRSIGEVKEGGRVGILNGYGGHGLSLVIHRCLRILGWYGHVFEIGPDVHLLALIIGYALCGYALGGVIRRGGLDRLRRGGYGYRDGGRGCALILAAVIEGLGYVEIHLGLSRAGSCKGYAGGKGGSAVLLGGDQRYAPV